MLLGMSIAVFNSFQSKPGSNRLLMISKGVYCDMITSQLKPLQQKSFENRSTNKKVIPNKLTSTRNVIYDSIWKFINEVCFHKLKSPDWKELIIIKQTTSVKRPNNKIKYFITVYINYYYTHVGAIIILLHNESIKYKLGICTIILWLQVRNKNKMISQNI